MKTRLAAAAFIALTIAGCGGAAVAPSATPGIFVPTAKLDPSQVEVMPPKEYVKVTPEECIVALDMSETVFNAVDAVLAADGALFTATDKVFDANSAYLKKSTSKNLAALGKAIVALNAAIVVKNDARDALYALDFDAMRKNAQACRDSAAR